MAKKKKVVALQVRAAPAEIIESPSAAIRSAFEENDRLSAVIKEFSAAPAVAALKSAKLAEKHFESWSPTRFSAAQRVARNYLAPGENLARTLDTVARQGAETLREGSESRALRLDLGAGLRKLMTPAAGRPGVAGMIPLGDLMNFVLPRLTLPSLKNEPSLSQCQAEAQASAWIDAVEGKVAGAPAPQTPTTTNVPATPALSTKELVAKQVNGLMAPMTPPEILPTLDVPRRATQQDATAALKTFELRAGASDVTSYHDFNSIQIAFEHVWTEVFDERLQGLGKSVYQAYIDHRAALGLPADARAPITSLADLKRLLADIRQLSGVPDPAPTQHNFWGSPFGSIGSFSSALDFAKMFGSQSTNATAAKDTTAEPAIPGATRLSALMSEIERLLAQPYAFTVFAPEAVNFGVMVTYRQTWTPENYQVGDLVSTIPLAPRETRRYTTKQISKKTRSVKELEDNLRTTRTEASSTSRVEREILNRAEDKTNFHLGAKESFGGQGYQIDAAQDMGGDQAKVSADTKKNFHEAVLKSAQEYRQQNRMEVDTSSSEESENTTFHEIQNPNDELTVTYLFYELQRTYRIQEKIHQIQPIILVANEVPAPHAIDDAWLLAHDWILRRVILDDSFRPALEYLTKSFVGAELNIQVLDTNAKAQKQVVDRITQQIQVQDTILATDERKLADSVKTVAALQGTQAAVDTVKRIFDPLGITGKADTGVAAGQTLVDYLQETFDRGEREKARLLTQLGVATTALQTAIDKLSAAIREHYDRVTEIDRLRIHVKANILYYMQAIWNHEPPDQRFFRVYNIDVPIIEPDDTNTPVQVLTAKPSTLSGLLTAPGGHELKIDIPKVKVTKKKLVEVADLDTVLGYKGNYAIYPLKQNNLITLHMMQSYLEMSDDVKIRDPDDFSNYTVEELKQWAACLYGRDRKTYDKHKEEFRTLIIERLKSGRPEDDRVIVPTSSLYIEALVGTHPLLEDFKLAHRALDVRKVQSDVRHAELENVRLAARAMEGRYGDPDVEKKIVIENGAVSAVIDTD